jgi:hypothetical protein
LRSPAWWTEAFRLENAPSNHFNSLLNTNVYPLIFRLSWTQLPGS